MKTIRNELIILLTPHVMRNMQEAKDVTSDYVDRFTRGKRDITREDLIKGLKRENERKIYLPILLPDNSNNNCSFWVFLQCSVS